MGGRLLRDGLIITMKGRQKIDKLQEDAIVFDLLRENKYHEVRHEINSNSKPPSIPIVLQEMPSFNNVSLPVVKPAAFNDNVIQVEEPLKVKFPVDEKIIILKREYNKIRMRKVREKKRKKELELGLRT